MTTLQPIPTKIEAYDDTLESLISTSATLHLIDSSCEHTEGPVYRRADDSVIWSDTQGDRMLQYKAGNISPYREPAHYQNGNALDLEGRLVGCSHRDRAIVRQEHSGEWKILVDHYDGKRLNSPNDVVVKHDGTIWFTDPPFGLTNPQEGCGGQQEQFGSFVFCFDPATGEINPVIKEMERPNGLAFSPDEQILYVSDTSAVENSSLHNHILAYNIKTSGSQYVATESRVFAVVNPGEPDGFCLDEQGNLYTSSKDSVQVYSPEGKRLGKVIVPETCANLTFGGVDHNQLFITAGKSLYTIQTKTKGAPLAQRQ